MTEAFNRIKAVRVAQWSGRLVVVPRVDRGAGGPAADTRRRSGGCPCGYLSRRKSS